MSDWTTLLRSGNAEIILLNLELSRPGGETHKGAGRLNWNIDEGIHFEAVTPAGAEGWPGWTGSSSLGQLIPPEEYYTLSAETQRGEAVRAFGIVENDHTDPNSSQYVTWRQHLKLVSLTSEEPVRQGTAISALLRPHGQIRFARASETSDDCPYFFNMRRGLDWLEFETSSAKVGARKLDPHYVGVFIQSENSLDGLRGLLRAYASQ